MTAFHEEGSSLYEIERSRLEGRVRLAGAKNSALRLLAASLLTSEEVRLTNYPAGVLDARIHVGMLERLGKACTVEGASIAISEERAPESRLVWEHRSIRNTLLVLGALTARLGEGAVPLPGGCNIGEAGARGFDLHVMLLEALGAEVWSEHGLLCARAPAGGLRGADIRLPIRSTGATENAILCGCLARGVTRVWNPHVRPEILDLIRLLGAMGAQIRVFGQEHIEITGVDGLRGARHEVLPDNVEALTWLVGAMVTGGEVEIEGFPFEDLEVPLIFLRESGTRLFRCDRTLLVRGERCLPLEISTGPYPGINSDMQPILAVYGAMAQGESRLIDLRFPGRYAYARELGRMGMSHAIEGNVLRIHGGKPLEGAEVTAHDLRTGIALALAGLTASGTTRVRDAWQVERGYDGFPAKLASLGGRIRAVAASELPPQAS